jgi:excisionase family DNA binding protein
MALVSPNGVIVGLLTPAETARYLACSERTLRNYVAQGLPFVQDAHGHKRFRVEDLQRWVGDQVRQSSSATPSTETSTSSDLQLTASDTADPLVAEISARLKRRLCGSTPLRSRNKPLPKTRAVKRPAASADLERHVRSLHRIADREEVG